MRSSSGSALPAHGRLDLSVRTSGGGEGRTAQSATLGEQGVFPRLAGQPAAYLYRQLWSFANGWRTSAAMPPLADGLTEADWTDIAVHLEHLAAGFLRRPHELQPKPQRLHLQHVARLHRLPPFTLARARSGRYS